MIHRLFFLYLLAYALVAQGAEPLIRVGMTEGGHEKEHTQVFTETRDALIKKFGKENVSFDLIHVNQLVPKILSQEVNFFYFNHWAFSASAGRRCSRFGDFDV